MYARLPDIDYALARLPQATPNTGPPFTFAYARTALKYGLGMLRLGHGDKVLVPEFICETLIHPMTQVGVAPVYFPVSSTFEPEWDAIETLVTDAVKAIVLVHYFGCPQDVSAYRRVCDRYHLKLIEDNAHGFGMVIDGTQGGCAGDIGLVSLRKTLPIPNGAILHVAAASAAEDIPALPAQPVHVRWKATRRRVARKMARHAPRLTQPDYTSQAAFREAPMPDWSMHQATWDYCCTVDPAHVAEVRRCIYAVWDTFVRECGLEPAWTGIPNNAAPLVLPAYAGNISQRNRWFHWGMRHGVDVHSWPTFPESHTGAHPHAMELWERLLCFPIHQEMDGCALRRFLDSRRECL